MMMRNLVLALLVATLGFQQAQAGKYACPNCDLDSPQNYVCEQGTLTSPISGIDKICVGVQNGLVACDNKKFPEINSQYNLSVSSLHCGACGNACTDNAPLCKDGSCTCTVKGPCLNETFTCATSSKTCSSCPANKGNCIRSNDVGDPATDCETDLTLPATCGSCFNDCGPGFTCQDGQCVCGDAKTKCTYPNNLCVSGACVQCDGAVSASESTRCTKMSLFGDSKFCNSTTAGFCDSCPIGMADCNATDINGQPDKGLATDCETNLAAVMGQGQFCGTCRDRCNKHSSMSCCSGSCKCGKYANPLLPTADECSAAVACSTTEYCDEKLRKCLPLYPGKEVCTGIADSPNDDDYFLSNDAIDTICESCNSNTSLANRVLSDGKCRLSDSKKCGSKGVQCRPGQQCFKGKCMCNGAGGSSWFAWNPFIDQDPDRDNKADPNGKPASGCSSLIQSSLNGFFDRSMQTLNRFTDCIKLGDNTVTEITPKDLRNATFRARVCPGGEGKCPAAFCDELFKNFTGSDRNSLCSAVSSGYDATRNCVMNSLLSNETSGDRTCANLLASFIISSPATQFTPIDMYSFLGCEGDRDDFIYRINPADRGASFQYRVETGMRLLGAGSQLTTSALIAVLSFVMGFALLVN